MVLTGCTQSVSKPIRALLACVVLAVSMAGCGGTYLISVEMTPTSASLVGIGATQQFHVIGHYANGGTADVTAQATFSVAQPSPLGPVTPANAILVNPTGLAQD